MRPLVSVIIVTFNSERYLPHLFKSIKNQTWYEKCEVIVIDNDSKDGTKKIVHNEHCSVIENNDNAGFAKANNQGIERVMGDYIFCLNHDVILEEDYIENLVTFLEEHKKAGAVSGTVKKWDFANRKKTEKIDTLGFKMYKNHKVVDITEKPDGDLPSYDVFGVSAAVVMYRKSCLDTLRDISGHYFDDDLVSYKEDVDIAYRILHAGYTSSIVRDAVAYHDRWETGSGQSSVKQKREARKSKPVFINQLSYRNHLIVLFKNEFWSNLLIYSVFILFFELQKFVYFLLFEPKTVLGLGQFIKAIPLTRAKRRAIFNKTTISKQDIRKWY
ncbi:glycosyltransferase family 2 protein [Patescibacteria group bacterium]|nr:glycosyltransferase family 2 protein [Patescibacteria group bacterium]